MAANEYEGLFTKREVSLIWQWAKRGGIQPDETPDVLQEVAMRVLQRAEEWPTMSGIKRKQLLWGVTRSVTSKTRRAEQRRCRRDEEKALMTEEAYYDDATPIRLDVQEVIARLDGRCQIVCDLLSQGLSKSQISQRMQWGWHTVDRLVRIIREHLEAAGVDAWMQ